MRQSNHKAAWLRIALLVVIPVLIIASATAGAATSTSTNSNPAVSSSLLHSSTKIDPVAQMKIRAITRVKRFHHAYKAQVNRQWRAHLRHVRHQREQERQARERAEAAARSAQAAGGVKGNLASILAAIAACESGGNPRTDTGNGFYGKYQFTLATWQTVGGSGNPAQASEAEQDARAAQLYSQAGPGQWPVCGR